MSSNQKMVQAISDAIGAHGAWKLKLRTAISHGTSELSPEVVRRDDQCAFGKWLHSNDIDAQTKSGKPYEVVTRLHADFHRCAAAVLTKAVERQTTGANQLLDGEFDDRSKILVTALSKWKGELQRG